ncbi:MAG: polysaccharide biosynthesis/export family protein [Candidatus Sulfotelmatobacter sp.]|jgi:polysaccharide export outer membrane protein
MEFGRFNFAWSGSLFGFAGVLVFALGLNAAGQQAPATSSTGNAVTGLPAAQPMSQAGTGSGTGNADPAKASASVAPSTSVVPAVVPADQNSGSLRLGAGDLIEVGVYNVPELTTKARIGNSGDVYLPLIDYVHVGDLTVEEAQALIEKRLEDGGFVRGAHVTIFLDESASQGVTILGEVTRPGIYPAVGNRKLYDLLSAAGGFSPSAGRKVSIIRQHDPSAPINLSLPRNLADDLQDNVEILPGDTITVPRAPIIYVVGDVGRPAGLLVDNGSLTVLQALALAGGTNHTAKMGSVRIIRKGPTGMTETRVPLKKMLEAKAPDMTLQADDILFVPLSGVRMAAQETMQAGISAATGIAVIAAHP